MAKGPSWTSWEDGVLEAARQARVAYALIPLVMPNRTPNACMVRTNVLRRQRGVPSSHYPHLEQIRARNNGIAGSRLLLDAVSRAILK